MTQESLLLTVFLPWIGVFVILVVGLIAALAVMWTPKPPSRPPQVKGPTQRMTERM